MKSSPEKNAISFPLLNKPNARLPGTLLLVIFLFCLNFPFLQSYATEETDNSTSRQKLENMVKAEATDITGETATEKPDDRQDENEYNVENSESLTEGESETETEIDKRIIWYMEHIPIPESDTDGSALISEASDETAPDKLKTLTQTAAQERLDNQSVIRTKLARYLKKTYGIILSEAYVLHFVYTDEDDYVVVHIGDHPFLCTITYSSSGTPKISEQGLDGTTRVAILEIAGTSAQDDEHFWNGIVETGGNAAKAETTSPDNSQVLTVPYFNQGLGFWAGTGWICQSWPNCTFDINGHTMHEAGCGFFAAAMAISYLKQEVISPIDFKENGQYTGDGAAVTVGLESAGLYGIRAVMTGNWEEAYQALQQGHLVMENVGPSVFANYGHYILLIGITDDGRIAVNDPGHKENTYWYSWVTYDPSTIEQSQRDRYTAYTIFG